MRISIPADVSITEVYDADKETKNTYVEVYVVTPTGISNRLLIPVARKPEDRKDEAWPVAFDLAAEGSRLDVYYQWMEVPDGKPVLVATRDPGAVDSAGLKITWNSPVGLAPKALQATFTATVGSQAFSFSLPANSCVTDDYSVDRRQVALILLKQLQVAYPYPTMPPDTLTMNDFVQPWLPRMSMDYRVQSAPEPLKKPRARFSWLRGDR